MYQPTLFRDRPRPVQIALGGVIPVIAGAVAGVLIGVSSGAYWGYAAFIAIASVGAGFEHLDGWGGADRGLIAGAVYGVGLLLAHLIAGTHAKVSLGSFPPFLVVITAIAGMLLSALGGYLARVLREREQARTQVG
jgi:asparagine N-glycosylation enzyme membrane subunit Stt3